MKFAINFIATSYAVSVCDGVCTSLIHAAGGTSINMTLTVHVMLFFFFFCVQVTDFVWPLKRMPDLEKLLHLCITIDVALKDDPKAVVVINCKVSKSLPSWALSTALFALHSIWMSVSWPP